MKILIVVLMLLFVSIPLAEANSEIDCLAQNLYFEARNQSFPGIVAVGLVTLNRVSNPKYPNTVCGVIHQGRHVNNTPILNQCQFSWYCDGKPDFIRERNTYNRIHKIAQMLYYEGVVDITNESLYYHASYVIPHWAKSKKHTTKIGDHVFYK